jgi:hypothetical protein
LVRLDFIDISRCLDYRTLTASTVEEHEQGLTEILEQRHSELWPDPSSLPPWKLIIVQSNALSSQGASFDVVFAFHHALVDGISGVVFHRSFLEALNGSENDN